MVLTGIASVADEHYPSNGLGGFQTTDSGALMGYAGARTQIEWIRCTTSGVTLEFYHAGGYLACSITTGAANETFSEPFELNGLWYVKMDSLAPTVTIKFEFARG